RPLRPGREWSRCWDGSAWRTPGPRGRTGHGARRCDPSRPRRPSARRAGPAPGRAPCRRCPYRRGRCARGSGTSRWSGSSLVPEEDRADVVAATAGVGAVDQLIARLGQVTVEAADDLEDGVVLEHVGEPVTAEQHGVAADEVVGGDVEVHLAAHAERLGEDVLHGPDDAALLGVGPGAIGHRVGTGPL